MNRVLRLVRKTAFPAVALVLAGCAGVDPGALASLPGEAIGIGSGISRFGRRPTSVGDVMDRYHTVMAIVATVKKYAELSSSQRSRVQRVVQRQHQGRLEREKKALAPQYAKRRADVRKKTATRVAAARAQSPSQAAKIEADSQKELAKIDADWSKAAEKNVSSKYGSDYAVPMTNTGGKPVVAFASVRDGSVQVASSAYEVGGKVAKGSTVKHGGREYAVVGESVSF